MARRAGPGIAGGAYGKTFVTAFVRRRRLTHAPSPPPMDAALAVLEAFRAGGWVGPGVLFDPAAPDDVARGLARHYVVRRGGSPILGIAVVDDAATGASPPAPIESPADARPSPPLPTRLRRWASNVAYNRRAPLALVASADEVSLLLTGRIARAPSERSPLEPPTEGPAVSALDGPADPWVVLSEPWIRGVAQPLIAAIGRDALTADAGGAGVTSIIAAADAAAARGGYARRGPVDAVLTRHIATCRVEILRGDELGALSAADRARFDDDFATLLARLLFLRHLEDRRIGGWERGRLFDLVAGSGELRLAGAAARDDARQGGTRNGPAVDAGARLGAAFAALHQQFGSELFPAASAAAYRMPAVPPHAVRRLVTGLYASPAHGVVYDFRALGDEGLAPLYARLAGVGWDGDEPHIERPQSRLFGKDNPTYSVRPRETGVFATPPAVVDTLLRLTLGRWLDDYPPQGLDWSDRAGSLGQTGAARDAEGEPGSALPRVLDVSLGSGAFLTRAYRYARELSRRLPAGDRGSWPAERWLGALHGADRDARAVALARLSLWVEFSADRPGQRLPALSRAVRVADSLAAPTGLFADSGSVPALPQAWLADGFDVVVGTPPALSHQLATTALGRQYVAGLRGRFRARSREANVAGFYVERALQLLRPGGYLGMVLPRNLLKTESGEALRRVLRASAELACVIDFLDVPVFDATDAGAVILVVRRPRTLQDRLPGRRATADAGTEAVILGTAAAAADVLDGMTTARGGAAAPARASVPSGARAGMLRHDVDLDAEAEALARTPLGVAGREGPWLLLSRPEREVLTSLFGGEASLGGRLRPAYAADEGLRGAFVLTDAEWRGDTVRGWSAARGARVELEARWMRPALAGTDIGVLGRRRLMASSAPRAVQAAAHDGSPQTSPATAMFYPYDPRTGEPVDLAVLGEAPLVRTHLAALQQRLMGRRGHGASDGWWVPRAVRKNAPWHLEARWGESIVLMRRHAAAPQVALVPASVVPTGNSLAWVLAAGARISPLTAVGLLSSALVWWLVQATGTVGLGKMYRVAPALLAALRLPEAVLAGGSEAHAIDAAVRTALALPVPKPAELLELWTTVDAHVCNAYGLPPAARRAIDAAARVYGPAAGRVQVVRLALGAQLDGPVRDDVNAGGPGGTSVIPGSVPRPPRSP